MTTAVRPGTGWDAQIHHVTLTVPDLPDTVDALRGGRLDVVDIDLDDETWQEAFLRPSQIGGLVVQIAHSATGASGAGEGASAGEAPSSAAARLVGAALSHPDLDRAARLWRLLGATVEGQDDELRLRWVDSPLGLTISPGRGGPIGLWMRGTATRRGARSGCARQGAADGGRMRGNV